MYSSHLHHMATLSKSSGVMLLKGGLTAFFLCMIVFMYKSTVSPECLCEVSAHNPLCAFCVCPFKCKLSAAPPQFRRGRSIHKHKREFQLNLIDNQMQVQPYREIQEEVKRLDATGCF